ncbi:hypothetical protein ACKWTF_016355 [Chironomus riparius]
MEFFTKILILILSHQLIVSSGFSVSNEQMSNEHSSSEGMSAVTTTQSPIGKALNFINSANFSVKTSMTEMCQLMHEYVGRKKMEKFSEKSECMRQKLRIAESENRVECNENPQPENSMMMPENKPKVLAFGFADILCDMTLFNKTIDAQFDRTLNLFKRIVKTEQVPCMKYKLNGLKSDSPLVRDLESSEELSVILLCQAFFDTFQSRVIDTLVKQDTAIFDKLGINMCMKMNMKLNMKEHETKRAYELGIMAREMQEDEVMDQMRAANFDFKRTFISGMLECYLNNMYGM